MEGGEAGRDRTPGLTWAGLQPNTRRLLAQELARGRRPPALQAWPLTGTSGETRALGRGAAGI